MPVDPDDVARYGMRSDGRIYDSSLLRNFTVDHPEWADVTGIHLSYEASILAWANGAPPPDEWRGITIQADNVGEYGDWSISINTDKGNYQVDLGDLFDLAWDFYDAADWYDYDVEKEIDTGGSE